MKNIITLFISALFLVSCGNSKKENDSNKNIIDVKTIIGKTESEIEKILGKAENSEKKFYQKNKFEIVFIDGKSDWITINNISNFDFNSENITLLGLSSTVPSFENTTSINWNDIEKINEVIFVSNGENKIEYIYIKAYTK
ncbi:hypothetical protein [Flavobacterium sp. LB2P44]|uniref:hypothetical protein n=1 Tax=Flavobacterium sp. LB2P44 TaxID=3401713 RepID=UPI003AACD178